MVQALRGMSFDEGAAALTPRAPASRGAAPVQREEAPEADAAADVTLDELLGDGVDAQVDELSGQLSSLAASCSAVGETMPDLARHPQGALALAGDLAATASELPTTATYDDDGELSYDEALGDALMDAMERGWDAVRLLEGLRVLVNSAEIRTIAGLLTGLGKVGALKLGELIIKAKTGADMMARLVASFQEHQALFEKAKAAATKDAVSLAMPHVGTLGEIGKNMSQWWSYYGLWEPVAKAMNGDTGPMSALDVAKRVKSYGMAAAKPACESLGGLAKSAIGPLGIFLNACQAAADLGLATGEVAVMNQLLQQARAVEAEYGNIIRFFQENEDSVSSMLMTLTALQQASTIAEAVIAGAESTIAEVEGKWGEQLYQRIT